MEASTPKKINTRDLAPLVFQKIPPDKMVRDYLHSKNINKILKKYPEWDMSRNTATTRLVIGRRKLYDAEVRLSDKRNEAIKTREQLNSQWKDLEDKEKHLRMNFIKFNKFVKENQEKRERAERKISEERALIEKKNRDISELHKKYEFMLDIRSKMEKNIRKHKIYEQYLQSIMKFNPSFRTLDDILNRYDALDEVKRALSDRQEKDLTALENAKTDLSKLTEEKTLTIMGLNNLVNDLQNRYEIAKNKALQWEAMVTRIKDTLITKLSELNEIRQASWSMYVEMCARKEIEPELDREDIEHQLLFIKQTMLELKKITRIALRRANKDNK